MTDPPWPFLAVLLLLAPQGHQCSPPHPACPVSCLCQGGPLLNCSSAGLTLAPQHILATVTDVDLSSNLLKSFTLGWPNNNLRNVWLGNNTITHLSLCVERDTVRGGRPRHPTPWEKQECVSWAPALQLLSVERNQLTQLPEGLQGSRSLRILQLSYNRISLLQPGCLRHLQQLKELHLHHNFITSIHPQALQDVVHLKVLDLSFNSLITITPMTYLSLRKTEAEVNLHGIRWQCDCRMRSVKRWMAFEKNRGQPTLSIVCTSPFGLSGRDLLQLEDNDLRCVNVEDKPEHHQDVTADKGSQILLPCLTYQDSKWYTPNGETSASQSQAGLLISNITETDAGLYVCVSESNQGVLTVFNLKIKKIEEIKGFNRIPRDVLEDTSVIQKSVSQRMYRQSKQTNSQPDLALAVSLSVVITFLVAFIIGVLARPFIDVLWSRVCTKKRSSSANPVSSTPVARHSPYENEAYCSEEEPVTYRERRVTFSTLDSSESINMAHDVGIEIIYENDVKDGESTKTKDQSLGVSGSRAQQRRLDRVLSDVANPGPTKSMEYEHIPDPDELENREGFTSSFSSSSSASVVFYKEQVPQSSGLVNPNPNPFQQRSHSLNSRPSDLPKRSIKSNSEITRFTSEPFVDWSPHTDNTDNTNPMDSDLWNDSGEAFEFPESIQSSSSMSSSNFSSFDNSNKNVSLPSHNVRYSKSSTSSISGDEPTEYTVNPYEEDEVDDASDNVSSLGVHNINCPDTIVMSHTPSYLYMTDSESSTNQNEAERADLKLEQERDRLEVGITIQEAEPQWPVLDFQSLFKIKKRLDIKAPSPPPRYLDIKPITPISDSSSSSSENEEHPKVPSSPPPVSSLSSSGSGDESQGDVVKQQVVGTRDIPGSTTMSPPAANMTTTRRDSSTSESEAEMTMRETSWPSLDLDKVTHIKRGLDIKPPAVIYKSSSSSSENEDYKKYSTVKLDRGKPTAANITFHESNSSTSVSEAEMTKRETRWPSLDLDKVTHVKRGLDIKPPAGIYKSTSSSSENEDYKKYSTVKLDRGKPTAANITFHESDGSTSESEAEMTDHKVKQRKDSMEVGTPSQGQEPQWPNIDFQSLPKIKKHLDIKAPSPPPISIESQNKTTDHHVKQDTEECNMINIPPEILSYAPETRWPSLDLDKVTLVKRCLDIKPPAVIYKSSSSSSESEDYKKDTVKLEIGKPSGYFPSPETETKKPDPCLGVPQLQRRLDIKAPSLQSGLGVSGVGSEPSHSDSDFSSSESKWGKNDENCQIKKEVPGIKLDYYTSIIDRDKPTTQNISPALKASTDHESPWAGLNLGFSRFRKHLDITSKKDVPPKVPSSPPPVSSPSSSGSGDESQGDVVKQQVVGTRDIPGSTTMSPPAANMTTTRRDSSTSESEAEMTMRESSWPSLDLDKVTHIKRGLDIKPPAVIYKSSSSSSENEDYKKYSTVKLDRGKPSAANITFHESNSSTSESEAEITKRETRWPSLDLDKVTHVKRGLDIKPPAVIYKSSSSSSENEDYKKYSTVKLDRGKPTAANITFHESDGSTSESEAEMTDHKVKQRKDSMEVGTPSQGQEPQWPNIDFQSLPKIKKRLDIKAPSPPPISIESQNKTIDHHVKQDTEECNMINIPTEILSYAPETRWPSLDLDKVTLVKRCLDIKPPAVIYKSSSSSSESEDYKKDTVKLEIGKPSGYFPSPDTETKKPDRCLGVPQLQRRLDIKAPSLQSGLGVSGVGSEPSHYDSDFSSSESKWGKKDENGQIKKEVPGIKLDNYTSIIDRDKPTTQNISPALKASTDHESPWAGLNLGFSRFRKHLDITSKKDVPPKVPSSPPPVSSPSSSGSGDESQGDVVKQQVVGTRDIPGSTTMSPPAANMTTTRRDSSTSESEAEMTMRESRWPSLDLDKVTHIKRGLDIKPPAVIYKSSSSSSENEDYKKYSTVKLDRGKPSAANITFHESNSSTSESEAEITKRETRWPSLDLDKVTHVKRGLDIKPPAVIYKSSSSSSENEDYKKYSTVKLDRGKPTAANITFHESNSSTSESEAEMTKRETRWPSLDLDKVTHVKRGLDIKPPAVIYKSSSSSSENEDYKKYSTVKLDRGKPTAANITFHESNSSTSESEAEMTKRETRWPSLDLDKVTHVKRGLDIKPPAGIYKSTSSSSENEDYKKYSTVKLDRGKPTAANITFHESDGSTSESEAEMTDHKVKQRKDSMEVGTPSQGQEPQWPNIDFQSLPKIKKRLDIKAPSPPPISIESQNKTTDHHVKQDTEECNMINIPPEILSYAPETRWPSLDLDKVTLIKRCLDIKPPAVIYKSSSSSSEVPGIKLDNYTSIIDRDKSTTQNISPALKASTDHESPWAGLNLGFSRFRKHLDITSKKDVPPKVPSSPPPVSSPSSSGSGDESQGDVVKQQVVGTRDIPGSTTMSPPAANMTTTRRDSSTSESEAEMTMRESRWPSLDLDKVTHIKRGLDIKPPAVIYKSSSSSSENEDYKKYSTVKLDRGKPSAANITFHESNSSTSESEAEITKRETRWPFLDLDKVTHVKRGLDIKPPAGIYKSTSSSSENEDYKKYSTVKLDRGKPTAANITFHESDGSTSESEAEMTDHKVKQRKDNMEVGTPSQGQEPQWPNIDFQSLPKIKKRLDIKAPSPPPISIESQNKTTDHHVKQDTEECNMINIPPEILSYAPETRWPSLDLDKVTLIKRCLDIKPPAVIYKSSSSSSEVPGIKLDNYTSIIDRDKSTTQNISPALKASTDHESPWAGLNLGFSRFRKHLDITSKKDVPPKVPSSPPPVSSPSSSGSGDESQGDVVKQQVVGTRDIPGSTTMSPPAANMTTTRRDSSTSESEAEMTDHNVKHKKDRTEGITCQEPESQWPNIDLQCLPKIKKCLDVKAPSQPPDTVRSPKETTDHQVHKQKEECEIVSHTAITIWPSLDLGSPTRIKRRLDIYPPSPKVDSFSSSGEYENADPLVKIEKARPNVSLPNQDPEAIKPAPSLKRCLDIKPSFTSQNDAPPTVPSSPLPVSSCSNSESESEGEARIKVEEAMWCEVNVNSVSRVKRCLDIKVPAQYESFFSRKSKNETTEYRVEQERDSTHFGVISHYRQTNKPDLSLPIPHIQRYQNFEALSPQTTACLSSHSESKTGSQTQDGMDLGKFSLRTPPNTSSDYMERSRAKQDLLPVDIRWNGLGRYLKDLSVTSQRRQEVSIQSEAPRMMLDPIVNITTRSTDEIDLRAMSEDKRGGKGLSALKALSSERRGWDTGYNMPK